jgi:hypothetical protein
MESFDMLHEEDHRQHNPQKKKGQTTIYKTLHKNPTETGVHVFVSQHFWTKIFE